MIRSTRNGRARSAASRGTLQEALAAFAALIALAAAAGCGSPKSEALPGSEKAARTESQAAAPAQAAPVFAAADPRAIAKQKPTYPLETCVLCGRALTADGAPKDVLHAGRLVRFCGDACAAKFAEDPAPSLTKIDAAIFAAQSPTYPLDVCVIEGGKLGAMGEPAKHVHGTRLVQFCCAHCEPTFSQDPAAAMAKLDAAMIAAQLPTYPARECPLMEGLALDALGEPFDFLYGTRLVRLCCEKCVDKFWENPEAAITKLDAMTGAKPGTGS